MVAASSLVFAAVMCWALHALGQRVVSNVGLLLSLSGLWTLAVFPDRHPHVAHVDNPQGQYVTVATDREYHLPGCELLEQKLYFASRKDAEAFGRKACSCVKLSQRSSAPQIAPIRIITNKNPSPARKYTPYLSQGVSTSHPVALIGDRSGSP